MISLATKCRTAYALGAPNLARVAWYRLGLRAGLNPVRALRAATPAPPFVDPAMAGPALALAPSAAWQDEALWFGRWPVALDGPPDWHANPLGGQRVAGHAADWWRIADFDPAVGDIKLVWEASRFDWVLAFAQQARAGDGAALARLNQWLAHWCAENPPYKGPNWKCGQEASIRVMHLAMAMLVLGRAHAPMAPGLVDLLHLHLQRIAPTISYAVAQDNNHGTSEAAALFIGGSWLHAQGCHQGQAARWRDGGRRWLENRVARLVSADGSFSQHSLTYHRMLLDTLSMAEQWRSALGLAPFSARLVERARAATAWLFYLVDAQHGDAPNLGANDGARLLQLGQGSYRDFRPAVQLASVLFGAERAYPGEGPWNAPLHWLGIALPQALRAAPASRVFDDGGFAVLRRGAAMAMLRYPRFRFRPSQADALHLDLWVGGENLLRDAGSYSYNAEPALSAYFPGTGAHNTVQFDEREQMPRWGRFLYADWLRTSEFSGLEESAAQVRFSAGYARSGAERHRRSVSLAHDRLQVRDQVAGFARSAVLRWRLAPGTWRRDGNSVSNGRDTLTVTASVPLTRFALTEGWESRHYLEKTALPVLEIEVALPGELISEYKWQA